MEETLELKKYGNNNFQWLLFSDKNFICPVCGKNVIEGYYCERRKELWHVDCFRKVGFKCGCSFFKEHNVYCVIQQKKSEKKEEI